MKKLLSFILILSLLLTFAFPAAQAGTITQAVKTAVSKIEYITANDFVTSLLLGAKVKPNGIADYWGKAVSMGLIPTEVKKDKPLTRAQASYIVWKLINNVKELKDKNIPVSYRIVPPTEAFMRGICFYGGPISSEYDYFNMTIKGYGLIDFIQGYQLLILEFKYADGKSEIKYVWDRYKGAEIRIDKESCDASFRRIHQEFKKKYPDKITYAPRPYQKGWLFTIDPVRDGDVKYAKLLADRYEDPEYYQDVNKILKDKNYPLTRQDIAVVSYLYHAQQREEFKGYFGVYNIKEHPYFNMYLEDFLINYPRKYPVDYKRFANYCKDYYSIPQLYREPMLYLADLGIITPDQSALYIGVYYFNPAKTLTRAEAVQMINRVFDKTSRDVLDEVSVKSSDYWIPKPEVGTGLWMYYSSVSRKWNNEKADTWGNGILMAQTTVNIRIEELKSVTLAKTMLKLNQGAYSRWLMTVKQGQCGFTYSAELINYRLPTGVLPYDEAGFTELFEYDKDKVISYVPAAYRDEFKKDINYYTPKLMTSKNMFLVKQYGDVYVYYNCWVYDRSFIQYQIYPSKPQMSGATFLTAKPNPKYTQ